MTTTILWTTLLPVLLAAAGMIIAFVSMHRSVYEAETPTKKTQLRTLQMLVSLQLVFGIGQGLAAYFLGGALWSSLAAGILDFAGGLCGGLLASKQLALGFMHHEERYQACRKKLTLLLLLPAAGLLLVLFL
jgi:hypothetical protein